MNLGELIAALERADQEKVVPMGFGNPQSYRGYYDELAFEPMLNVKVSDMLAAAKSAVGATYTGYKGGSYRMNQYTPVWIAEYGNIGEGIGPVLLSYMLGAGNAR